MMRGPNLWLVAGGLVAILAACLLGSTPLPPDRMVAALVGMGDAADRVVVWEIRLPRALAAWLVGLLNSKWPDVVIGYVIAVLFFKSAWPILRDSVMQLRQRP